MDLTHEDLVRLGLTRKGKWQYTIADIEALPEGVRIKNDIHNYVEPDITLICDDEKLERNGCHGAPDFVVEIVSPSNRKMDYVRKLALYRETGL